MGTVSQFPILQPCRDVPHEGRAGELLAMRHLDLETVIETVRVLRTLKDQSILDCFNRAGRVEGPEHRHLNSDEPLV